MSLHRGEPMCLENSLRGLFLCNNILTAAATVLLQNTQLLISNSYSTYCFYYNYDVVYIYCILGNCRSLGCISRPFYRLQKRLTVMYSTVQKSV